jgi:hypothetical protein
LSKKASSDAQRPSDEGWCSRRDAFPEWRYLDPVIDSFPRWFERFLDPQQPALWHGKSRSAEWETAQEGFSVIEVFKGAVHRESRWLEKPT